MKHPEFCFECGEGNYVEVVEDYHRPSSNRGTILVPKLLFLRCNKCGEDCIPPESLRRIDYEISK